MLTQKAKPNRAGLRLVHSLPPDKAGGAQKPPVGVPFKTAEEAWFWYMAARKAQADGAEGTKGIAEIPRPCEPVDMYNVINRLYRGRLLGMSHFRVLKYYGERFARPDPNRRSEYLSARLWDEAMAKLEPMLVRRGIMVPKFSVEPHMNGSRAVQS